MAMDDFSNWEGMLKGWIPAHLDVHGHGTYRPAHSDATHRPAPKWRGKAQKLFMTSPPRREDYDIEDRVYEITCNILLGYDEDSLTPVDIEELLDEIQAYAEEIDVVQVLHTDGVLSGFLTVLYNKHANVRAKAAEVVTTMVQNYPTSRQVVIEWKGLVLLLYNLTADPDATSMTKALGAISALLRNNKPGITEFQLVNGYAALLGPLSSESVSVRFQKEALVLIRYLLHENISDCNIVTELGLRHIMEHLASSDDSLVRLAVFAVSHEFGRYYSVRQILNRIKLAYSDDPHVREAALSDVLEMARIDGIIGLLPEYNDELKQVLEELIKGISAMAPEDLGSARKEIQLLDSVWNAFYNEPSSLGSTCVTW